jgi:hypothetical protein
MHDRITESRGAQFIGIFGGRELEFSPESFVKFTVKITVGLGDDVGPIIGDKFVDRLIGDLLAVQFEPFTIFT